MKGMLLGSIPFPIHRFGFDRYALSQSMNSERNAFQPCEPATSHLARCSCGEIDAKHTCRAACSHALLNAANLRLLTCSPICPNLPSSLLQGERTGWREVTHATVEVCTMCFPRLLTSEEVYTINNMPSEVKSSFE